MKKSLFSVLMILPVFVSASNKKNPDVFYVYQDKMAQVNHYVPSGFMGDWGSLKVNEGWIDNCQSGHTCIQVIYSGKDTQGANWAGIYWQNPPNNWGTRQGGYDLSKYKKLTFWAKGEKGNERIATFKVGGITGDYSDSDSMEIGPIDLTKEWKKYEIDLHDKDLKHISGGFCWSASKDDNPEGFMFYLDEIRYEK